LIFFRNIFIETSKRADTPSALFVVQKLLAIFCEIAFMASSVYIHKIGVYLREKGKFTYLFYPVAGTGANVPVQTKNNSF